MFKRKMNLLIITTMGKEIRQMDLNCSGSMFKELAECAEARNGEPEPEREIFFRRYHCLVP
jgi:hypothetical protein